MCYICILGQYAKLEPQTKLLVPREREPERCDSQAPDLRGLRLKCLPWPAAGIFRCSYRQEVLDLLADVLSDRIGSVVD